MFAYHEATKHTYQSVHRSGHMLDWDNMPDPFRHYEGVPVVDLPAGPPPPETPTLDLLRGLRAERTHADGAAFLSTPPPSAPRKECRAPATATRRMQVGVQSPSAGTPT